MIPANGSGNIFWSGETLAPKSPFLHAQDIDYTARMQHWQNGRQHHWLTGYAAMGLCDENSALRVLWSAYQDYTAGLTVKRCHVTD